MEGRIVCTRQSYKEVFPGRTFTRSDCEGFSKVPYIHAMYETDDDSCGMVVKRMGMSGMSMSKMNALTENGERDTDW
jgi:hypothetical protein